MEQKTKPTLMDIGVAAVIGIITGAITNTGLIYLVLSPLAAGAIIAAAPTILFAAFCTCLILEEPALTKTGIAIGAGVGVGMCIAGTAIGAGLAAAANAVFPGVMLSSPGLIGAVIGAIAPIAAFAGLFAIVFIAQKVSEYLASPEVEQTIPSNGKGGATAPSMK